MRIIVGGIFLPKKKDFNSVNLISLTLKTLEFKLVSVVSFYDESSREME